MDRDCICRVDIGQGCVGQQPRRPNNQLTILGRRKQRFKCRVELIANPSAKANLAIHEVKGIVVTGDDDWCDAIRVCNALELLVDDMDLTP